jgi:uncharacterized protein
MKFNIKHDGVTQKFFTAIGGKECILRYDIISETIWDFRMLFVPANLRGQGIAAKVVEYGLNFARKNAIRVKASCSYVKDFVEANKSFQDVLLKHEHVPAQM